MSELSKIENSLKNRRKGLASILEVEMIIKHYPLREVSLELRVAPPNSDLDGERVENLYLEPDVKNLQPIIDAAKKDFKDKIAALERDLVNLATEIAEGNSTQSQPKSTL